MLIVNDRRVENLTPKSRAREVEENDLESSIHGPDGRPAIPLQDKLFRMSGETGSYKYMARNAAGALPLATRPPRSNVAAHLNSSTRSAAAAGARGVPPRALQHEMRRVQLRHGLLRDVRRVPPAGAPRRRSPHAAESRGGAKLRSAAGGRAGRPGCFLLAACAVGPL